MIAAVIIAAGVTFFAGLAVGYALAAPHVRAIERQPWIQIAHDPLRDTARKDNAA